jgi:hypothetical protein
VRVVHGETTVMAASCSAKAAHVRIHCLSHALFHVGAAVLGASAGIAQGRT